MNRQTLPLNEIIVENRQREDLGDIASLADSIQRYGLIQPIVITQDKRLIAGGRRFAAVSSLGLKQIDVVYRETLTEDELYEMELEENVRRKDFTWQERVLNIATIHSVKKRRATLEGNKWGQKETAEALGLDSACSVNYSLKIAERLRQGKDTPVWQCDSMMEAYRLLLREEEDQINAELAKRQLENQFTFDEPVVEEVVPIDATADILSLKNTPYLALNLEQARQLYLANPLNDPDKFDEYYKTKLEYLRTKDETVTISNMLYNGDSIKFMYENSGCF